MKFEAIAVHLPVTTAAFRPTVPIAWFAFISERFVAGPYEDRKTADKAGAVSKKLENKLEIDYEPGWPASVKAVYRRDLSTPPFYVWEFTSGATTFFAVMGPGGWAGPAMSNAALAQATAARYAESMRDSDPDPNTGYPGAA